MALKTAITGSRGALTQIMNVSAKVGTEDDCRNLPNDVEAVQRLFNFFLPRTKIFAMFGALTPSGKLDALTAFYIFKLQRGGSLAGMRATIVDGCVSRATGFGYGGNTEFVIVALNEAANSADAFRYQNFMNTFTTSE